MSAAASVVATNLRASTISEILSNVRTSVAQVQKTVIERTSSLSPLPAFSMPGGPGISSAVRLLKVLFYGFLLLLVIFIILVIVHYTIRPIFRFLPGQKGIISIPGYGDDKVYWNKRKQPSYLDIAPSGIDDSLVVYPFENEFSLTIDLLLKKMLVTDDNNRLILAKTYSSSGDADYPFKDAPTPDQTLASYMALHSSMAVYLTTENDMIVTFYSGSECIAYSCPPIKNVPLDTPFRLGIVVDKKIFTVYINDKQVFQRITPTPITINSSAGYSNRNQRFYPPPPWTSNPSRSIYVQNLHLWPRVISYNELKDASPALAKREDFNAPQDVLKRC